ncbi:hypothetical protein SGFS_004250 [Streptomyces graminofaciens]|uniref:Transposase n=1 Tax=Streptomyces graminofaciens TaxID=68212 RepID=A0ABM7F0S5_9ACTN|nr:hypothetical protein SGFS_004250 [Streptomyces graminofaciens]
MEALKTGVVRNPDDVSEQIGHVRAGISASERCAVHMFLLDGMPRTTHMQVGGANRPAAPGTSPVRGARGLRVSAGADWMRPCLMI